MPYAESAHNHNNNTPGPDGFLNAAGQGQASVIFDFIRIAIPILLLLLLTFGTIHYFHHTVTRSIVDVREHSRIKIGLEAIRSDVQAATSDLMHLAESRHMRVLLESGSDQARNNLAHEFSSVLKAKKNYDQIRYLDPTGMEVVRVNYNSGMPLVVPDEKLQSKGRRYYFTDVFKLERHRVFVSPMDLNIENGKIEIPLKPMLRFGTPVYDHSGQKRGVVLVNYYADTIRDNIRQFLANPDSAPMLLNTQGHWLLAPHAKDEWGFMFKNKLRFNRRYPDVWDKIIREKTGQVSTRDGLFTFITIYPLQKGHYSSSGSVEAFEQSDKIIDDASYFWILLTHIPQMRLNEEIYDHVKQGALQFFIVSLIVMPLIWFYSRERVYRKWAHRELHKKEQYLRTVTSQLAEGLLVIDRQGSVMTMNKEAEHLLGWTSEELIGSNLKTVLAHFSLHNSEADRDCEVLTAIHQSVSQRVDNTPFLTKTGEAIPVSFSVAPYRCDDSVPGAIITFRDISQRLEMEAELKILATHDPLTGVKNRGEIERCLKHEINRAARYHRSLAILMMDIDQFKSINDTYGHQNGDEVLRQFSEKIVEELRSIDVTGRYGGEEFLVILPETELKQAAALAERLRQCIAEMAVAVDKQTKIRFTVSIGVSACPESADEAETLVQIADNRLYEAKAGGRNRVVAETGDAPPLIAIASSEG